MRHLQRACVIKSLTIISEIKRASPSKGDLNLNVDVQEQGKTYERCGASAISVLTDTKFFSRARLQI
ncbi:hypothetical protein GCM10020331_077530 [Ectobacillus funiculus]